MTSPAFVPAIHHDDGSTVAVYGTGAGIYYLVVRRLGCQRAWPISHHEALDYRDSKSEDVERFINEMKAELVHAIRQGEGRGT